MQAQCLQNRAYTQFQRGANRKAIDDCSALIKISPNDELFCLRATVYRKLGKLDAAIADLTESVRRNPNMDESYLMRGEILARRGELDRAIADFTRVIEIIDARMRELDSANNEDLGMIIHLSNPANLYQAHQREDESIGVLADRL